MNDIKNPQAFPTSHYNKTTGERDGHSEGMTLLDYFAAKALQSIVLNCGAGNEDQISQAPKASYLIAERMLKERKKHI